MPWVKKSKPTCLHPTRPDLPKRQTITNEHMLGDIWQCENCHECFQVVTKMFTDGDFRETWEVAGFGWKPTKYDPLEFD